MCTLAIIIALALRSFLKGEEIREGGPLWGLKFVVSKAKITLPSSSHN